MPIVLYLKTSGNYRYYYSCVILAIYEAEEVGLQIQSQPGVDKELKVSQHFVSK